MQSSERNTRSLRKLVPDQPASPGPESQTDTGQYMCIECSETFDTRLELNSHSQSHVTKKQFTCTHCGRGFHHQVFLQMHERSHEDGASAAPGKTTAGRVISTRSSKMPDVVHVKPTPTKPPCLINSIVEFKDEQKAGQAVTPKELVTRRTHGTPSVSQRRDSLEKNNLFELRISKYSDRTVTLLDSFGNSIEILADVFNTYTIGETEQNGETTKADEALANTSEASPSRNADEICSKSLSEEPSVSPQTESTEPPPPVEKGSLLTSHELVTSETITSEDLDSDLRAVQSKNAATHQQEQSRPSSETLRPEIASTDKESLQIPKEIINNQSVNSAITSDLPVYTEDHMETSPAGPTSPQHVLNESLESDQTSSKTSAGDKPGASVTSQEKYPKNSSIMEPPNKSKDPSFLDAPSFLNDSVGREESKQRSVDAEAVADLEQNPGLSLLKPEIRQDSIPPPERQDDHSSTLPESSIHKPSNKESVDPCNSLSVNRDLNPSIENKSAKERGAQNEEAAVTFPGSERLASTVSPENLQESSKKNLNLDTDALSQVSISEEINLDDGKDAAKHCSILVRQDMLHDHELVIDDKRDDDLFERDIFPLGSAMENLVCGKSHSSKMIQQKESDLCLNGSDMTYISESEMIKLLEQDKDDITDDEPITTDQRDLENIEVSPDGDESKPKPEAALSNNSKESSRSPVNWDEQHNTAVGVVPAEHSDLPANMIDTAEVQHYPIKSKAIDFTDLPSETCDLSDVPTLQTSLKEKMDTDSGLPVNKDDQCAGGNEPQDPIESMETEDLMSKNRSEEHLGLFKASSSSNVELVTKEDNPDIPQLAQGVQGGDQNDGNSLSRTERTSENVTPEVNIDTVDKFEDSKANLIESISVKDVVISLGQEKLNTSTPDDTVSIIKEQQTKIDDALPLSQKELGDAKTFPANDTETRDSICSQEGISPPQNAPLEDRDHVQSITDDQDRSNPASPGSTNLKSDGMANQQEGTDIPSVQSSELGELPTANPKLGGPEVSSNIDAEEDLEEQSSALPKANDDLESEVTKQADALTNKVSDTLPVCNDLVQGSLEDSDLVENDHQDDLDSKPLSSGGECVKCGRKLRRSRKDLAWSPVCFKCRLVAKKRDRLSNQEAAEDLDLAIESGTEKSFPEDSSKSVVEHEDELPQDLFNKPSAALDPLVAVDEKETPGSSSKKTYKCPKCDEAFRIPALLAGHIKCHTLPQCVSCGCQMRLKYKTKRIPRRCQKCFQQLKEKIKARQSVEDVSGEGSDSDEEDIENADVTELSPGKRLDEEVDSFEQDEESSKKPENESSDELDVTAQDLGSPDGENPRLCNQCGKAFKCKRSLNLHLLSHSGSQCESCGCRLAKKRRVGRWSKKCRACRLQTKDNLLDDVEDEMGASSQKAPKQKNAASLRVKAKQSAIGKNTRTQSIVKKKKELKWMNMLLAVKGLMDKSRRKKENALQAATSEKKEGEGSGTEKSDVTSADDTSADPDKSDLNESDMEKASGSGLIKDLSGTPKPGRKCLYREKNIIKVEESETYIPTSAASIFIKQEETWQCLECTQSWPNSEALVNHQRSHISGESLTCPQCPQVFSSEQYLDVHVLTHDENRPFRCPECNKTFTKRNHLGVHMRVHTGSRPYACPECPCRFRQKVTLIAHRYTHRNYQMLFTKPFQCSVCSKSFKQKERLVVHERSHTGECPFSCKDCDQVFPSKARLYVHRRMHKMCDEPSTSEQNLSGKEISEGQPFRCQDCGKVCTTKASFVLHRKVHRLSSIPIQTIKVEQQDVHPFFCRDCNKAFSTKGNLTVHLKKHSAHRGTAVANLDVKGGYPCKDCDKLCLTKASLVLHRKVHKSPSAGEPDLDIKVESDTPSYNCKYCNKVCSTKASLVLHCKVHRAELGTEKPSFKCKVCDMVFSTKASFVLHRKVHRSSSSNPQSPKTDAEPGLYSCKHCDMVCSTKASFVLHSKVHKSPSIGEENAKGDAELKLYNCKHCDMVCSTKAGFVLHNKVHRSLVSEQSPQTEEEPQLFNCKHCDMICSTKASFVLHNKVHRSSLSGEQSSKASEEPQSYSCKHCDMVCSTKASFVLHNKVHRSAGEQGTKGAEEPQSYSCKDCDMAFSTKGSLALHSKVHRSGQNLQGDAEGNPFVCKDCNKVCSTKASLVLHRKVHRSAGNELNPSGDAEDTTLPCKDCGKMFSSKRRLSIHRHKFHDVSLSNDENSDDEDAGEQAKKTNEEKPFSCPICDLRFAKLKMLVRHKAVHGERTVTPCIHCGKRFLYMKSLFNHIKVCQSKSKGKKMLKKVAVKRKILKDGGSGGTSSDGESGPKKRKADDKPKALTAAQKLKNKNMTVKAKKAGAGKGKGRSVGDPKVKEKRVKVESDDASEGEGKSDAKQEKPSEQPTTEPVAKKNATKIKKVKKEPSKEKAPKVVSGGARKWRVLAASTVKKKNLQAVLIGGKKKLLLKKKVQLKPKPGGKVGKD